MKNIDYLELFFRKHNLSGKIKVKFSSPIASDDTMTDIIFENGDIVNINDIIFDIESEFPEDLFDKWMEIKRQNDISFIDWIQTDIKYVPSNIDKSSSEQYHKEMDEIFKDVIKNINTVFDMEPDDGDSDEDIESEDE